MTDFTSHEAAVHDANALPVMLPVKLIGRDLVLAKIYAQLKDNQPVLIHGAAGVGKTALAATLASAYTDLPGGVVWINAHNPALPDLVTHVGRAYQIDEVIGSETPLALIGAAAGALMAHKPLVVLDGAFDAQVAAEFVTRCASGIPMLVVADESHPGPWTAVPLEPLDEAAAALMFKHLSEQDHPNGEENDGDVAKLVKTLEFMPFALAVAAGAVRAHKQTPAEFLANLPQIPGASASLVALTAAFRMLTGPLQSLQGLLITLGATFGGVSAEILSLLSGASTDVLKQAMGMLAQRHLIERYTVNGEAFYALHPITYAFAQSWLRGAGRLEERQGKLRDALLSYARTHSAASNFDKLALEMDNFLALARWSADQNERDTANQLAVSLMQAGNFVNERGYVYELLTLRRLAATSTSAFPAYGAAAQGVLPPEEEAEELEEELEEEEDELDLEAEDRLLFEDEFEEEEDEEEFNALPFSIEEEEEEKFATAESEATKIDQVGELSAQESSDIARLRAALFQARQQNNRPRQAEILTQIGQAQVQAKMENEAISTFSETLTVYEALNDNRGVLATLDALATLTAKTDNLQAAVLHATRGIPIAEQLGDKARQMRLLMALGDARQQLGESPQAARAYAQALELARNAGDSAGEALLLFKLGYAQLDDNTPEAAVQTWESALKLFREQGRRDYEGRVLGGLGTAYGDLARWSESINFHTSALYIAREVKDKEEEALQLSNLGYANIQANQLGQAVLRYRQALHLAYESGSADNIVSAIVDLVRLLVESPRHLSIAELLIDDALKLDPNDRDVKRLKERIQTGKQDAAAKGIEQRPVSGTARDYAALAYKELEA